VHYNEVRFKNFLPLTTTIGAQALWVKRKKTASILTDPRISFILFIVAGRGGPLLPSESDGSFFTAAFLSVPSDTWIRPLPVLVLFPCTPAPLSPGESWIHVASKESP